MPSDSNHPPLQESDNRPDTDMPTASPEDYGLPPVKPPSGRFIAQLFLIPGLIVGVLVLIWLGGTYLMSEGRTPAYFMRNLESGNEDIRWRAALDLAQVLQQPNSINMAADPKFALDLAERLRIEWTKLKQDEENTAKRILEFRDEQSKTKEWNKLEPQRNYLVFLIAAQGRLIIPLGAPVLCEIAVEKHRGDNEATLAFLIATHGQMVFPIAAPVLYEIALEKHMIEYEATTLRRQWAIWALANLGQNLERYEKISKEKQKKILAFLKKEKGAGGRRGDWAAKSYDYLAKGRSMEVDAALASCAKAKDFDIRTFTAHALNFWVGPATEATLIRLSYDRGHGTKLAAKKEK